MNAANLEDGWCIIDWEGGIWWPDEETAKEIEASPDPDATAVRIATEEPMRGKWYS